MNARKFRPYFDLVASGKKMRSIRKARNISVEQVRQYLGFESVQAIYKWERGECFPQADTLIALSLLYQVNPIELFEEDAKASSFLLVFCRFLRDNTYNRYGALGTLKRDAGRTV